MEMANAASIGNTKYSLMMLVASDPPVECFDQLQHFLTGATQTSQLVVQVLNQLSTWETDSETPSFTRMLMEKRLTSFIDMYPWPKKAKADLPFLLQQHRQLLAATCPLVVVSFSEKITGLVQAGFKERQGRSIKLFELSGTPKLCSLEASGSSEPQYYVSMPCYHPGAMTKTNSQIQEVFGSAFTASIMSIWLAMSFALDELTSIPQSKSNLDICQSIIRRLEDVIGSQDNPTHFGEYLSGARQAYRNLSSQKTKQSRRKSEDDATSAMTTAPTAPTTTATPMSSMSSRFIPTHQSTVPDPTRIMPAPLPGSVLPRGHFGNARGESFKLSTRANTDIGIASMIPLQPQSCLWLFNEFLVETYLNNESVHSNTLTGVVVKIEFGDPGVNQASIYNKLAAFCQAPKFRNHPTMGWLQSNLGSWAKVTNWGKEKYKTSAIRAMIANLYLTRESNKTMQKSSGTTSVATRFLVLEIKLPAVLLDHAAPSRPATQQAGAQTVSTVIKRSVPNADAAMPPPKRMQQR